MKWQLALGLLLCAALAVAEPTQEEKAEAMADLEALSNVDESSMSEEAVHNAKKFIRARVRVRLG
ncbi:hypothetical protein BOX15_Mlig022076g3 [Macrostomum lignano]|uniref:Uncharacterized protein n=1 Tax=Macrostomum lignano TaxID=282301 RepID=A0A267GYF9_9PLAT|nr:hypothetical protein BOX15_Mlig022076g1 [Macrostomum lignano]PAA74781.1 hypothetical protein BOX15_Mlig022076g2 [Macrostomum lignano]PAA91058.1 hypothetical protein BOX15_Mlig022076g3 [Macrostomum lignano]